MLFQTGTFWISILACACFSEPIIPLELVAMVICFGMMITITVSSSSDGDQATAQVTTDGAGDVQGANYSSAQMLLGYALVFICAWTYAINCVLARALNSINASVLMFWHGVLGLLLASVAIAVVAWANPTDAGLQMFNYDHKVYGLILAATLFDTLGVNSQTIAFQSGSSGFVSLVSYVNVLYAFLSDCLIFHESFSWVQLLASSIILIVTVITSVVKLREKSAADGNQGCKEDDYAASEVDCGDLQH